MDCRDVVACTNKWYKRIDKSRMIAFVERSDDCDSCDDKDDCLECETGGGCFHEIQVPIKFDVCHLCQGRGNHVNPSIDSHGISPEEFYEDPDFYQDYRSGVYDVPCYECDGEKVVPVVDEERAGEELLEKINEHICDVHQQGADDAHAIRMGY